MSAQPHQADPGSDFGGAPVVITLALSLGPLTEDGQASLAPDERLQMVRAVLRRVVQRWHNALNETTVRCADDLFACAVRDGSYYDPLPKGAELTGATIDCYLASSPEPHAIEIKLPNTLILQYPADAPRVIAFLRQRGFVS